MSLGQSLTPAPPTKHFRKTDNKRSGNDWDYPQHSLSVTEAEIILDEVGRPHGYRSNSLTIDGHPRF